MALGWFDEKVDCLVGSYSPPCFGDLGPEFLGLGGAVGLVYAESAGVDGSEEVESKVRLAAGGKGKGLDYGRSHAFAQEAGDACTDARCINDDSATAPDF